MLQADGWFSNAIRRPGPSWKQNGGRNASRLFVGHSVVGYRDAFYDIMNGPARKSVHLFNPKTGPVEQLYPAWAQCWASGATDPNNNGLTMELEGGPPGNESEPMTDSQLQNVIYVLQSWADHLGHLAVFKSDNADFVGRGGLTEHNQWFPTACPSGRYPWPTIVHAVNFAPDERMVRFEALSSVAHFNRMGWPQRDQSDGDKDAIRRIVAEF